MPERAARVKRGSRVDRCPEEECTGGHEWLGEYDDPVTGLRWCVGVSAQSRFRVLRLRLPRWGVAHWTAFAGVTGAVAAVTKQVLGA